jgi:D-lactate dehydrogenase
MWRVKQLADPEGVLAPGIVLNRDPGVHLRNLMSVPEIEDVATKCIECGFCEPVCPSRHVTTTPRQRIALRREMARQPAGSPVLEALLTQYEYDAVQTCAADSSCAAACPVGIDTGQLVKQLRRRQHSPAAQRAAAGVAQNYAKAELVARAGLRAAGAAARVTGDRALTNLSAKAPQLPAWNGSMPRAAPSHLPATSWPGAAAVYLPACLNRIFGNARHGPAGPTVPEAMVAVSARAGLPLWIPDDVAGHCCGVPWSSKGYVAGHAEMARRTAAALRRWTESGRLPVVIDASSCTLGVVSELELDGIEVLDSVAWLHDRLLDRLAIGHRLESMAVHPTCACTQLGLAGKLTAIARRLADEVLVPGGAGCCGMAGDRGWRYPELPQSALREVTHELDAYPVEAYASSNRTCELALGQVTGRPYRSIVLIAEELTRP